MVGNSYLSCWAQLLRHIIISACTCLIGCLDNIKMASQVFHLALWYGIGVCALLVIEYTLLNFIFFLINTYLALYQFTTLALPEPIWLCQHMLDMMMMMVTSGPFEYYWTNCLLRFLLDINSEGDVFGICWCFLSKNLTVQNTSIEIYPYKCRATFSQLVACK